MRRPRARSARAGLARVGPGRGPAIPAAGGVGAAAVAACLLGAAAAGAAAAPGGPRAAALAADTTPENGPPGADASPAVRPWSFPPGERFQYEVRFGRVKVGEASLAVEGVDTLASGNDSSRVPAYRVAYELEGGIPFYRIDDRSVSWVATDPLRTLRFEQHLREGSYRRDRRYLFDQEANTYSVYDLRDGKDASGGGEDSGSDEQGQQPEGEGRYVPVEGHQSVATAEDALDEIAYLYLARMLPLRVGETYRFDRYFEEDGNPVVLKVLRRETVRVPAGKFRTVVVRPIIKTGGVFSEGGEAEVYLTDDDRRLVVQLKTKMKVGHLNMYLTERSTGDR